MMRRRLSKIGHAIKAISPVISVLLMIAIAVVAALIAYAWVTGYLNFQQSRTGNSILIQSYSIGTSGFSTGKLVVYVQNVGLGLVHLKQDGTIYVNAVLTDILYSPKTNTTLVRQGESIPVGVGETVELVVDYTYTSGESVKIKVVTVEGAFMEITGTANLGSGSNPGTQYQIVVTQTANGLISPGTNSYAAGSTPSFTITPASGFIIDSITVNGIDSISVTSPLGQTYQFSPLSADGSITATYLAITPTTYIITPLVIDHGTVAPNTPQAVNDGSTPTFTITAASGYQIQNVLVDGSSVSGGQGLPTYDYTFSPVHSSHQLSATFSATSYSISLSVNPSSAAGTVSRDKNEPYTINDVVTLTPNANQGYTFDHWSGDGVPGSGNTRVVTVTGNMAVTAYFTQDQYTLTLNYAGTGSGTIGLNPASGQYTHGTVVTVTANPNAQTSDFAGWSGGLTGAANPSTLTMYGSTTVTATFNLKTVQLALAMNPTIGGSIVASLGAPYHYGDQVRLTVHENPGYTFSAWIGDLTGTANGSLITLNGDKSVTATFTQNPIDHFEITGYPTSTTAGEVFVDDVRVKACDAFGSTLPWYVGTVTFTSTDQGLVTQLPFDYTFTSGTGNDNGIHTFSGEDFMLTTAGPQTITVADGEATGTTGAIAVAASYATHFVFEAPSTTTAGSIFSVTVTAADQFDNVATGYTGTVGFESTDIAPEVILPGDYTFQSANNGVHAFTNVKLVTADLQGITVFDTLTPAMTGYAQVDVQAGAFAGFYISAPASITARVGFTTQVTAMDQFGNTVTTYTGTVHFTSSDHGAGVALPSDYAFTSSDSGVHQFDNVKLVTIGAQTITATAGGKSGTSDPITVNAP
jgi:uncharacterized repeat protein (TIGR02543 family)/flagellin-like protein